ncbi:MAG TPA: helix-turn-helix transcriptional regulator [Spirochaetia bacterium]|nr:helix-turn-helix transcriptional regulator [Spirochaetia bacterium]
MLTIEQIREKLADRNVTVVAEKTGIHRMTIYRLINGSMATYDTIKKLSDYLTEK